MLIEVNPARLLTSPYPLGPRRIAWEDGIQKGCGKLMGAVAEGCSQSELWPGRENWSISIPLLPFCTPVFWGLLLAEPNRQQMARMTQRSSLGVSPPLPREHSRKKSIEMNSRRANQTSMVGNSVALDNVSVSSQNLDQGCGCFLNYPLP